MLLLAKERIEGITKNVNDAKNAEAEDVDVDDEVESDVDEEENDIDDDEEEGSLTLTHDVADNRLAARPSDKLQKPSIDIVAETSERQQQMHFKLGLKPLDESDKTQLFLIKLIVIMRCTSTSTKSNALISRLMRIRLLQTETLLIIKSERLADFTSRRIDVTKSFINIVCLMDTLIPHTRFICHYYFIINIDSKNCFYCLGVIVWALRHQQQRPPICLDMFMEGAVWKNYE